MVVPPTLELARNLPPGVALRANFGVVGWGWARTVRSVADDERFRAGQVITIFRSRLRGGADDEYFETAAHMKELAQAVPGFVDHKSFTADDGERVSLVTFADEASQQAWRTQVDHRAAQAAGRDRFYAEYSIQVGDCTRAHSFLAD